MQEVGPYFVDVTLIQQQQPKEDGQLPAPSREENPVSPPTANAAEAPVAVADSLLRSAATTTSPVVTSATAAETAATAASREPTKIGFMLIVNRRLLRDLDNKWNKYRLDVDLEHQFIQRHGM